MPHSDNGIMKTDIMKTDIMKTDIKIILFLIFN